MLPNVTLLEIYSYGSAIFSQLSPKGIQLSPPQNLMIYKAQLLQAPCVCFIISQKQVMLLNIEREIEHTFRKKEGSGSHSRSAIF